MNNLIDRREALRKTALMMGAAVSASTIAAFLHSCKPATDLNYNPVLFNNGKAVLVAELADIIITKTDTPGAKDVGVPGFIDKILKDCYKEEDQKSFLDGLKEFDENAIKAFGDKFVDGDASERLKYVQQVHDEAVQAAKSDPSKPRPFILKMKELTMLGYFTSEAGATQVLQYQAVPGAYKGCIPLAEAGNGKAWAS